MKIKAKRNLLIQSHGPVKAGTVVEVSETSGNYIIENGLGELIEDEPKPKKSTTKKKSGK